MTYPAAEGQPLPVWVARAKVCVGRLLVSATSWR